MTTEVFFAECPSYPEFAADRHGSVWRNGQPLPYTKTRDGYLSIGIKEDGKSKRYKVHKLVADAFLGPCPDGLTVDHCNQDKLDNSVDNLRYISAKEQQKNRKTPKTNKTQDQTPMLQNEIWLPITEGPAHGCKISNMGRFQQKTGKITRGYPRSERLVISVTSEGKTKLLQMHLLVAEHFCKKENRVDENGALDVLHLDGDVLNNAASNLEWVHLGEKSQITKMLMKDADEQDSKRQKQE